MLSAAPWLVTLSRHKPWTFGISGVLIATSFVNMYYVAPRLQRQTCSPDNPDACEVASRVSRTILWISAIIYAAGFFVAFLLGPILARFDRF
jgi:mercuric ion transport protein